MEILLYIILEPLFFVYYDFVDDIIGEKKLKKWQEYLLKALCLIVSLCAIFMVIIGAFWLADTQPFQSYGKVLLIVGTVILLLHLIVGFIVGGERLVKKTNEERVLDYKNFKDNQPKPIIQYVDDETQE